MRINVIGMNFLHTTWNKQNQGSNMHRINKYPCDTVSFTSKTDSRKEENNLVDALATIGFVGIPLVSSIIIGTELMKHSPKGNEIFLSDGSYLCNVKDLKLESDKVIADADDGIFKVEGTGIDINPDRFSGHGDIFDPEHGIYRTADGSIDIDLLNNKYIDTHNGIFVDPDEKISTLVDEDGEVKHFVLPSFAGYQTWPYPLVTRNDDDSIGEEGFLEKFANSPLISGIKDLFDRDVVMATDDDGNEYPSTMPENLSRVHGTSGSLDDLSQDANDSKFDVRRDYYEMAR